MHALTEAAIRASLINCTKGEAARAGLPKDLDQRPWPDLDFLGWREPAAPQRAYLVTESEQGPVGVALRVAPTTGLKRKSMCSLCLTTHGGDGVQLMTARKAGPQGRQGDSVGAYLCSDLACSLHLRGKGDAGRGLEETLTVEEKVDRMTRALSAFLGQVRG